MPVWYKDTQKSCKKDENPCTTFRCLMLQLYGVFVCRIYPYSHALLQRGSTTVCFNSFSSFFIRKE